MLNEITIQNFAIIDNLTLRFHEGFNVLTGETGAGKSIILDAVTMLMGERADSNDVRAGEKDAIVEGVFTLDEPEIRDKVNVILTREELLSEDDPDSDLLVVNREIRKNGRSIARINGRTTTLNVLKEVGELIVDIHGQGDHLSLLKPAAHIDLLDRYGGLWPQRMAFAELVHKIEEIRNELRHLLDNEAELKRHGEALALKVNEISAMELQPGEDVELQEEAKRLGNAERLSNLAAEAQGALSGATEEAFGSANDLLTQAAMALAQLSRIDESTAEMAQLAEDLSIQVEELGRSIADYQELVEADPVRLTQVEVRLESINGLKRRYDCDSIEELLQAATGAADELQKIEGSDERIKKLQEEEARLLSEIGRAGVALSSIRAQVADTLSSSVEAELGDLRMADAQFSVVIEQVDDPAGAPVGDYRIAFDNTGIDRVEFLLAPNLGEPPKPMARIASGGETSRIMLALKTVLSRADKTATLIFDEIDTGIGGRIGAVVGEKLWSLSSNHQVLVVTHLPQLAGFGDIHWKVEKGTQNKRTVTTVYPLEPDSRLEELSAMLGAESESARQNAQELLTYVDRVKRGEAAHSAG